MAAGGAVVDSDVTNEPMTAGRVALVLVALAMGGFAIGVTEFAAMSILPDFAAGLGVDAPTAGHVISAYAAGVVVGAPILAVLGARSPRWLLLIGFMALFAVGNGLSALAPTYEWMLVFRFLSGMPHGAYFGVAALVAASVVPLHLRTRAVSTVLMGLTVATVIGVPFANMISHAFGWRWTFAIVSVLAVTTMGLVALFAPRDPAHPDASPVRELGALKRSQVWLTLGVGAVGFGGMFAVYAADRVGFPAAGGLLLWSAAALALYPFAAPHLWAVMIVVFLIGGGGGLGSVLQTRLMDVAGDAQTLAAALNHSAFNTANAIGPLLGGMAIAAGYGWTSTGWVGVGLSLGGFAIFVAAWAEGRRRAASKRLA